ncbi:MAG: histidinol-phosphate aminotransferase family protein [Bacteroidetes bacterium]|nr:histidinol-phosphate aminotransferase family protein [Bacteroidota bacterium]
MISNLLTEAEQETATKIKLLKEQAGTHSPSIFTIAEQVPELNIKVDACFLSNPYATELFLRYLKDELINTNRMRDVLEFYPSQNSVIAGILSDHLETAPKNIFIGNGAIEIIQAVIHNFTRRKILINIPTFSSYYEFVKEGVEVVFNKLKKEDNYQLNIEEYLRRVMDEEPDTVVLINPNNPDGQYIKWEDMRRLIHELRNVETVIIDKSFIHFAFEDENYELVSYTSMVDKYPNLVVLKSMSKDFGIAGIRAGYAVMNEYRISGLLKNGYLWNSSGLSEYFFRLYVRQDFLNEYEKERIRYIKETQHFFDQLREIRNLKAYPSKANFALIELFNGITSSDFVTSMLIRYGVYSRTCSDKIGLEGEFVRLASRTREDNEAILSALKSLLG